MFNKRTKEKNYNIISDKEFRDRAFPFFESDEATMNVEPSIDILQENYFSKNKNLRVDYIIWFLARPIMQIKLGPVGALGLQEDVMGMPVKMMNQKSNLKYGTCLEKIK